MLQNLYQTISNVLGVYTFAFVGLEIIYLLLIAKVVNTTELKVSMLSGVIAIFTQGLIKKYVVLYIMFRLYSHRWVDVGMHWYTWVFGFFVCTFLQFFAHYLYHKVRLLWCFHVVHHNALEMNTATGLRNSVLDIFSIDCIYFLVPLVGVPPIMYFIIYSLTKFWGLYLHIHQSAAVQMKVLEKIIVSPSLNQVHHASNEKYIDKNFGELIPWYDMLWGTYVQQTEAPIFGTAKVHNHLNFWQANLHEFQDLWSDIKKANKICTKFSYAFMPPGWAPN